MSLKKWFYLFVTTILWGGAAGIVTGLYLQWTDQEQPFGLSVPALGYNITAMVLGGVTLSILSQMGYFAYLSVRFIAVSILRSRFLWDILQGVLTGVTLFDLAYFRHAYFAPEGSSFLPFFDLPLVLLIVGAFVAFWKVKQTNRSAFVSTLFFISAVTTIEAVPALKLNNTASVLFMMVPLLVCNTWQIMITGKILQNKKS